MSPQEIRRAVVHAIQAVAPDTDPAALAGDADLREALDIDSMDFLNVVVKLHEELGIDVPEADYAHFYTLDGAVAYLGPVLAKRDQ